MLIVSYTFSVITIKRPSKTAIVEMAFYTGNTTFRVHSTLAIRGSTAIIGIHIMAVLKKPCPYGTPCFGLFAKSFLCIPLRFPFSETAAKKFLTKMFSRLAALMLRKKVLSITSISRAHMLFYNPSDTATPKTFISRKYVVLHAMVSNTTKGTRFLSGLGVNLSTS